TASAASTKSEPSPTARRRAHRRLGRGRSTGRSPGSALGRMLACMDVLPLAFDFYGQVLGVRQVAGTRGASTGPPTAAATRAEFCTGRGRRATSFCGGGRNVGQAGRARSSARATFSSSVATCTSRRRACAAAGVATGAASGGFLVFDPRAAAGGGHAGGLLHRARPRRLKFLWRGKERCSGGSGPVLGEGEFLFLGGDLHQPTARLRGGRRRDRGRLGRLPRLRAGAVEF